MIDMIWASLSAIIFEMILNLKLAITICLYWSIERAFVIFRSKAIMFELFRILKKIILSKKIYFDPKMKSIIKETTHKFIFRIFLFNKLSWDFLSEQFPSFIFVILIIIFNFISLHYIYNLLIVLVLESYSRTLTSETSLPLHSRAR